RYTGASHVVLGGAHYPLALFGIDGRFRRSEIRRSSRFDFHECQFVVVPCDDIDLAASRGHAVVTRHHRAAVPPQMAMREVLADASVILGVPAPANPVGCAVDKADHLSTSNSNCKTLPRTTKHR